MVDINYILTSFLPDCLVPILTQGVPKNADSLIPEEELPTIHLQLANNAI